MIKSLSRLFRGAVAIVTVVILDEGVMTGVWAIATATIATYLLFTAVSGECIIREYLIRPSGMSTGRRKL
jgi:hypothetical protein